MKHIFTIFFLLGVTFFVNAQSYLLVNERGVIKLLDYSSNDMRYREIHGDELKMELIKSYGYDFVGYNWEMDSLVLYLEKNGVVISKKMKIADDLDIPVRASVQEHNLERFWRNDNNDDVTYHMDHYTIVRGMKKSGIKCYEDSTLLWNLKNEIRVSGIGYTSASPVFSSDRKTLLFQYVFLFREFIMEIDVRNGEKTRLVRNRGKTLFDYSSDGNNVLYYNKKQQISIYNTRSKKKTTFLGWSSAFWLYKQEPISKNSF